MHCTYQRLPFIAQIMYLCMYVVFESSLYTCFYIAGNKCIHVDSDDIDENHCVGWKDNGTAGSYITYYSNFSYIATYYIDYQFAC